MSSKVSLSGMFADKKKIIFILLCLIIGVILIMAGSEETEKIEVVDEAEYQSDELLYSNIVEDRLEEFLRSVDGIDSVSVLVTLDGGNEYEYAQKGSSEGYASDYLVIKGDNGEEAAVVRQIYPEIRGVGVSCTGGETGAVKEEVTSLLSAALGISANKIKVTGYG